MAIVIMPDDTIMYAIGKLNRSKRLKPEKTGPRIMATVTAVMLVISIAWAPARGRADASTALTHRVDRALRANDNLNGAMCYTAAPGVIVLYGRVFDANDRRLAAATAGKVRGVRQVVNTLRTEAGQWNDEEEQINATLQLNGLENVSARVIGPEVYLSGTVTSEADKQRAARVVRAVSKLQQNNLIWVKPGPLF